MIPLRLTLHDFLSYRRADLDLSEVHTACICGANGAGKSALLEALCWGIWGQSRASQDQDLIRKGSTTARVTVVYRSQGQVYRVMRTRSLGGGISLEWQIQNGQEAEPGWRSLTRRGIKATQQGIQAQLRLDYETFINSAYLRQGKADEFTLKRASDRKQILADILKLSQYDALAEQCREQVKLHKIQADQLQSRLEHLAQQRSCRDQLEQDYQALIQARDAAAIQLSAAQAQLEQLRIRCQERDRLEQRYQDLTLQSQAISSTLQATETQWRQQRDRLHQIETLLGQEVSIQVGCQHYHQLLRRDQQLNQAFEHHQQLSQRQRALQTQQLRQQQQHQTQLESLRQQLHHCQIKAQADQPLLQDQPRIRSALKALRAAREQLQAWDSRHQQAIPLLVQREQLWAEQQQQHSQLSAQRTLLVQQIEQAEAQHTLHQVQQAVGILEADLATLQEQWAYREQVIDKIQQRRLFVQHLQERQRALQHQWQQVDQHRRLLQGSPDQVCPLCQQTLNPTTHTQVLQRQSSEQEGLETELFVIREQLAVTDRELELLQLEHQDLDHRLQHFDQRHQEKGRLQQQLENQHRSQHQLQIWQAQLNQVIQALAVLETPDPTSPLAQVETALAELGYSDKDHTLCRHEVERWRWAESRWAELERAKSRHQHTQHQIDTLTAELAQLEQTFAQAQQDGILSQLAEIDTALTELSYDPREHHQVKAHLTEAQSWIHRWHQLQQAQHHHPTLQQQTQTLATALQQQRQHLAQASRQLEEIHHQLSRIPSVSQTEIEQAETTIGLIRQDLDRILAQLGALQERRQALSDLDQAYDSLAQEHHAIRHQLRIHQELATAYGPHGIPAMLIENALPELEAEANRILGRLSQHQLHLHFASQRATRRADKLIDTLDILIADPRGTRPYETYSGGEAFRINFAIRLALSQLLARRAGSQLQTLLIDEGFGTQDQSGREQLIGAINAIASDFACILVITHIPSLQDAFSQRIEVERTPQGSRIRRVG